MNGILPLWKNTGMTSHECVVKVRHILKTKKVGHTGTLDPEVEGVLPLCIGEATKITPFLTDTTKTYVATVKLGFSTDTEDQTGKIEENMKLDEPISKSKIEEILPLFVGNISQQVPLYSAVKVNGRKLYEYARENIAVERPYRTITIYDIELLTTTFDNETHTQSIQFKVTCSKGTYVRTLCVDIGKKLGFPAHMSHLMRTATGNFEKSTTITLDGLREDMDSGQSLDLIPIEQGLTHLDKIEVDKETRKRVLFGQKLSLPEEIPTTEYFRMMSCNEVLAVYQLHDNGIEIKPARVFNSR